MDSTIHRKECSVLGSLLVEWPAELPPSIASLLRHAPDSFDDLRNGSIASTLHELHLLKAPIHTVAFVEHLKKRKLLERCGGYEHISLITADALPLSIIQEEAIDVWKSYQARQSRTVFEEAKKALESSPEHAVAIIDGAISALKSVSESHRSGNLEILEEPLKPICKSAIDRYEMMRANVGKLGVPTGIPSLDKLSGGMKPGQTIVVAGTTGGGKSTFGLHMANAALSAGVGVALFSLEMDREEIFDLLLACRCRIDRNKFNNGTFSDYDIKVMAERLPLITKLPLYIEDSALSDVHQIRSRVLQLKAAKKIGLVIVDYIQFVNPDSSRETREQQVSAISHALRALARETKLPTVVLSQLNDEGKLRESRVIAHNANVVMVVDADDDKFTVKVVKGRGIPEGEFSLEFQRRFASLVPYQTDADTHTYATHPD